MKIAVYIGKEEAKADIRVKEMLERLHNQPHGKRLWIETFSRATGKVIRPGEVLDWEGES